jgi:hypothetical protein
VDDVPADYEPEGFVNAGNRATGLFAAKPFAMYAVYNCFFSSTVCFTAHIVVVLVATFTCTTDGACVFVVIPLRYSKFGEVVTPFHAMGMACKSVLDTTDVKEVGPFADDISRWQVTEGGITHQRSEGDGDVREPAFTVCMNSWKGTW